MMFRVRVYTNMGFWLTRPVLGYPNKVPGLSVTRPRLSWATWVRITRLGFLGYSVTQLGFLIKLSSVGVG
jgi:hypothetical protein